MLNIFLSSITNKTTLMILMGVLIGVIVLLAALAIVFIVALRKRAPVIKVVMAPPKEKTEEGDDGEKSPDEVEDEEELGIDAEAEKVEETPPETVTEETAAAIEESNAIEDNDEPTYVTEGSERVRYSKSFTAKMAQCADDTKEWYTALKNDILSYSNVRVRMSWKRESFMIGRMVAARFVVRGKTLCLLLAVEPDSYQNTKFSVEDVSGIAANETTPTLYRIKSERRMKYAKEMLAGFMKAINTYKNVNYQAEDFYIPYEGTIALMQRGLIKRIVSQTTRTFKVEEVDKTEVTEKTESNAETEAAATSASADADKPAEGSVPKAPPKKRAAPKKKTSVDMPAGESVASPAAEQDKVSASDEVKE